jgi:hypothetical protein
MDAGPGRGGREVVGAVVPIEFTSWYIRPAPAASVTGVIFDTEPRSGSSDKGKIGSPVDKL